MRADIQKLKQNNVILQGRLDDSMSECNQLKDHCQQQALLIELLMNNEAKDVRVWRNVAGYWRRKHDKLKEYYDANVVTVFRYE